MKIVCLGDSITYGYDASTKMKDYHQVATPYPKRLQELLGNEHQVINSGNVGWQARQTIKHLDELVFKYQPDICLIMLGINDSRGSHQGFMVSKKNYMKNMHAIIDQLTDSGIKPIILTPTPVKFFRAKKFYYYALELANKNELLYLDLYKLITEELKQDGQSLEDILKDNVHLNQEYYLKLGNWVYNLLVTEFDV